MNPKNSAKKTTNSKASNSPWLVWRALAAFATVLLVVFSIWWVTSKTFDNFEGVAFERQSSQLAAAVSEKFQRYSDFLLLASQNSQEMAKKPEWAKKFKGLGFLLKHPDIRSVFFIFDVQREQLPEFLEKMSGESSATRLFPLTERNSYKIVSSVFSTQKNGKLIGFDLASTPILAQPLEESARLGYPTLSQQLALPIARWARGEMLLFAPVYSPKENAQATKEKSSQPKAYLGMSFLVRDFFRPLSSQWQGLAMRVTDKTQKEHFQYLFETLETSISEVDAEKPFRAKHLLRLGGRIIEIDIWASSSFRIPGRLEFNWAATVLGVLLAGIAALLVRSISAERETNRLHIQVLDERISLDQAVINSVLDSSFDCIISIDEIGRVFTFNKAAERILGFLPEEVIGKPFEECLVPEAYRQTYCESFAQLLASPEDADISKPGEVKVLRADGRVLSVLMSFCRAETEGKQFFTAHLRDDSERIRVEADLRNRTDELQDKVTELSALNSISSVMEKGGSTFDEMLEMAAKAVAGALGEDGQIGAKIIIGDKIYLSGEWNEEQPSLKSTFFVRGTIQGEVEIYFNNVQSIRPFYRQLVKAIASRLTGACDAKLAEEAMRTSEERFRDIVENASDWFWEMDEALRFSFVSDQFFETMGVHASEIIGKQIGEVKVLSLVEGDQRKARQNESILEKKQPFRNFEYLIKRPGGQQSYVRISGHPLYDETDSFKGYRGAGTDITARKRAEELIREANAALEFRVDERTQELKAEITERKKAQEALTFSEKRFKDVAEASSDWIWETDAQYRLSHLSERISDLMDVDLEHLLGKQLLETNLDISFENNRQDLRGIWEKHEPFRDVVLKIIDLSHKEHFVKVSGKPVMEKDGTFAGFRGTASDITEQTRSEVTLHRLSRAIEHSPSLIIITDPEGKIEYVNPRYEEITGFTLSEVLGELPMSFEKSQNGEPGYEEIWPIVSSGGEWSGVVREYKKTGECYWASVSFTSVTDDAGRVMNYIGAAEDITERREAEEQIRFQASLLKQVRNAVIATGLDGRISYMNKYAEELWGIRSEDALERNFSDFVNIGKRPERQSPGWRRIGHDYYEGEFYAMRNDGTTFPAFMTTTKMTDADGLDLGFIRVILDLSDRKKVDAQLVQASKLATIGEMAAGMAHELNQPINIIRMTADAGIMDIDDGLEVPESRREVLSLISDQTQRMAEIINHMRVLSRKDEADQELFSPIEAITAVADLIERQFQAEGIGLEMEVPQTGPVVKGRRVQFEQVVLNLLTNARDAIKTNERNDKGAGGVIKVKVKSDKTAEAMVITVSDSGGGIAEEALAKVFEPFYTTKAAGKGTGLGLSVSMSLIGRMEGSIEVKNTKIGAEFTIALPVSLEEKGRIRRPKRRSLGAAVGPRKEAHLLIVDDEVDAVRVMAKFFKKYGYAVSTAFNGVEAMEFFNERPADLVVTDMRMPKMNGRELIETLRNVVPDLPIIAVTGQMAADEEKYISEMTGTKAGKKGVQKLFKKPVDLSDLLEAVEGMLQK